MTPEAVCKSLSSIGYAAVEWTLAHFNPRNESVSELARLLELTHDFGLQVSEIVVQQDYVALDEKARADRIALTIECIEAAAEVGVTTLNLFSGPTPWDSSAPVLGRDVSEGTAWEMVFDALDVIVPLADKKGVELAMEPVIGMLAHDYYTTLPILNRYGSERLGINCDPSALALYRNDPPAVVHALGSLIKHVHLKDAVGIPSFARPGEFLFPLLGEGMVDWQKVFAALDDIGYGGFLSVEFESFNYYRTILGNDVEQAARISFEQVGRLMGT
jgi:sugar phosphate isomerase/epimerase